MNDDRSCVGAVPQGLTQLAPDGHVARLPGCRASLAEGGESGTGPGEPGRPTLCTMPLYTVGAWQGCVFIHIHLSCNEISDVFSGAYSSRRFHPESLASRLVVVVRSKYRSAVVLLRRGRGSTRPTGADACTASAGRSKSAQKTQFGFRSVLR